MGEGERVITQEGTKLFRASVLFLGKTVDCDFSKARIEFVAPLPVYDDCGKEIGAATVSVEAGGVRVGLVFDYGIPARLDIENGMEIYAHPRGTFKHVACDLPLSQFDPREEGAAAVVHLKGVTLSPAPAPFGARVEGLIP